MAINGMYTDMNYYRFMSNISNSNMSASTISNVGKLVSSQFSGASSLSQMLQGRYTGMQENLQKFASYQKDATKFYSGFGDAAANLKSSATQLSAITKSTSTANGFGSANSGVASVTGGSMLGTNKLDLTVSSLASAQKETSASFTSSLGYTLGGKSELQITSQGKTTSLSFNISNVSNNKEALTEIAGKINGSKLGITASVETKNGMSSLSITSNETGKDNGFSINYTGNLEKLNMQTTSKAQDAQYVLDGAEYSSASNNIKLGETGLSATLNGTGRTSIEKGMKDNGKALSAVKNFVNDYNDMVGFLKDNSSKSNAISDLAYSYGSTRFQATSLSEIGITTKSDGTMSVNEEKFNSAMGKNPSVAMQTLSRLAENTNSKTQTAVINSAKLFNAPKLDSSQGFGGVYNSYSQFVQNPNVALNMLNMLR